MTPKYNHAEAFKLMTYKCESCHYEERIWNSRDGVTPFGINCPKCNLATSRHINWQWDEYLPEYIPVRGQRVFVDMPESMKLVFARRRAFQAPDKFLKERGISREELTASILEEMHEGEPFVIIMP
jgi:hypothetical protein